MTGQITVNESILFWAFRYCLGRRTYAVSDCADNILDCWDALSGQTKQGFCDEIMEALAKDQAGMDMDKEQWLRVVQRHNQEFSYE